MTKIYISRDVNDTSINNPQNGESLIFFNGEWINQEVSGSNLSISGSDFGATGFLTLDDTPGSYVGESGKVPVVKVTEDGIEFVEYATDLDDLNNVAINTPVNLEVLTFKDNSWINKIVSGSDHTHVESEIIDLNHIDSFLELPDTPSSYSGSSGMAVIVNESSNGLVFSNKYSLTVEEQDSLPSVANVNKIKIPNGTLIDNGNGIVTMDFGSALIDGSAIHSNTGNEISAITEKSITTNNDLLLIEDSESGYIKKSLKISDLFSGGSSKALPSLKIIMNQTFN